MANKKRRGPGRVTPRSKPSSSASPSAGTSAAARSARGDHTKRTSESVARYTPPKADYRVRPGWHRIAGWLGVAAGILVVVLNDGMYLAEDVNLLPFGHSELYLMLGLGIAAVASWFLGVFDRGTTIYQ